MKRYAIAFHVRGGCAEPSDHGTVSDRSSFIRTIWIGNGLGLRYLPQRSPDPPRQAAGDGKQGNAAAGDRWTAPTALEAVIVWTQADPSNPDRFVSGVRTYAPAE